MSQPYIFTIILKISNHDANSIIGKNGSVDLTIQGSHKSDTQNFVQFTILFLYAPAQSSDGSMMETLLHYDTIYKTFNQELM